VVARKRLNSLDPQKLSRQYPAKIQKKAGAPDMISLRDPVAARIIRINEMKRELTVRDAAIKGYQLDNDSRLDSLATCLRLSDSLLVREAISGINLHDIYDDEVISLSRSFKDIKYKRADTLQKYYLIGFDLIATLHESKQKLLVARMDLYKQNLRSLEQYGKWNNSDTSGYVDHASFAADYQECIDFYNKDPQAYAAYVQGNKKLFGYFCKLSRRQLNISY
jgi:hypothetical protein